MYCVLRTPCPYLASIVKEELEKYGVFQVAYYGYNHTARPTVLNNWHPLDVSEPFVPVSDEYAELWIDDPMMVCFAQEISDSIVLYME